MTNTRFITFTKEDYVSLQHSAKNHSEIEFLLDDLSPDLFDLTDDVRLSLSLDVSDMHLLFQTDKKDNFNDISGIVNHIIFEFGMQHSDDMMEVITETLNDIPLNVTEQLTQDFLHFQSGVERSLVNEYIKSAYPS